MIFVNGNHFVPTSPSCFRPRHTKKDNVMVLNKIAAKEPQPGAICNMFLADLDLKATQIVGGPAANPDNKTPDQLNKRYLALTNKFAWANGFMWTYNAPLRPTGIHDQQDPKMRRSFGKVANCNTPTHCYVVEQIAPRGSTEIRRGFSLLWCKDLRKDQGQ